MSLLSFLSERQHAVTFQDVRFRGVVFGSPLAPFALHCCDSISTFVISSFVQGGEKKPAEFDSMLLEANCLKPTFVGLDLASCLRRQVALPAVPSGSKTLGVSTKVSVFSG